MLQGCLGHTQVSLATITHTHKEVAAGIKERQWRAHSGSKACGAQVWKRLFPSSTRREEEDTLDATPYQIRRAQNRALAADVGLCFRESVLRRAWLQGLRRAEVELEEIAERQLICTSLDVQRQKCWTCWLDVLVYLLSKIERLLRLQGTASLCSAKSYVCYGQW